MALVPSLAVKRIGAVVDELEFCRTCRPIAFSSALGRRVPNARRWGSWGGSDEYLID